MRNLYGEYLDPRTTSDVQAAAEEFSRRFPTAHAVFIGKLRTLAEGRRIAQRIRRADPDVRDVILFGSLVEDGPRRKDFDIDLAISGGDVFKAMEAAEDSPFEIDIVCLERLPAHIRNRVRKSGVALE
jgi:hypothetical protein